MTTKPHNRAPNNAQVGRPMALELMIAGCTVTSCHKFTPPDVLEAAVRGADIAETPATLAVIGESAAGRPFPGAVGPGQAVRIFTGAVLLPALPTLADLVARRHGTDWPQIVARSIGLWAAGRFDQGQALWTPAPGLGAFAAWREWAVNDLTPEIAGLRGFCAHIAAAPDTPDRAILRAAASLGLTPDAAPTAFHRLLVDLGGWAQHARWLSWQAEQAGGTDTTLTDPAALEADLARIRHRGFSFDDEERSRGMRCIAAPVFDLSGEAIAGISELIGDGRFVATETILEGGVPAFPDALLGLFDGVNTGKLLLEI